LRWGLSHSASHLLIDTHLILNLQQMRLSKRIRGREFESTPEMILGALQIAQLLVAHSQTTVGRGRFTQRDGALILDDGFSPTPHVLEGKSLGMEIDRLLVDLRLGCTRPEQTPPQRRQRAHHTEDEDRVQAAHG
jgi:hypothetical protein